MLFSLNLPKSCVLSHFSCINSCDPMDCSPEGSSVHGIILARMLEWIPIFSSRKKYKNNSQFILIKMHTSFQITNKNLRMDMCICVAESLCFHLKLSQHCELAVSQYKIKSSKGKNIILILRADLLKTRVLNILIFATFRNVEKVYL